MAGGPVSGDVTTAPGREGPSPADAVVVDQPGLAPVERLARALDACGVWPAVTRAADARGVPPAELPVVIIPEMGAFAPGSAAAADPRLVEALIDALHDHGCTQVIVGSSADWSSRWAGNRGVDALADLLGYAYVTPAGRDYDVIDLGEDLRAAPFAPGAVLAGTALNRVWLDAGFRIVVASNRTDEADGYALALHTAIAALPEVDTDLVYRLAADPAEVVAALLAVTPVHLALIDALISCHGSGGARAPRELATDTLIAARDPWLADVIGALKMGLDPALSPLVGAGPPMEGLLAGRTILGSLAPYPSWRSPDPAVVSAVRARDRSPWWSRLVRPWVQVLDTTAFPLESPLDAKLNTPVSGFFADLDDDPVARAGYVALSQLIGALADAAETYRTLYAKDSVTRVDAALDLDLDAHPPEAYAALVAEIEGLARLLDGAPARAPGLRWRHVDGAVVFSYARVVPIPFDELTASVDVATMIATMNDYLGGSVVIVEADEDGRPRRQAERNLYLPQPNWIALFGGQPIDVSKLEVVAYEADRHCLWWKTMSSANGSATFDDGSVTFERGTSGTRVRITGRQLFTLPPALRSLADALPPAVHEQLVTDAYVTFFDRTLANVEALTEGRDIRIGRSPIAVDGQAMPSAVIERLLETVISWTADLFRDERTGGPRSTAHTVDTDGFHHFSGSPDPPLGPQPAQAVLDELVEVWTGALFAAVADVADLAGARAR